MAERRGAALPTLTPEQILARYPADVQELAERLRTLVRSALGEPEERVYAGRQHPPDPRPRGRATPPRVALRPADEPAVEKWRASSSTG